MLKHPQHGDRLELLNRPGSRQGSRFANPGEAALSQGYGHVALDVDGLDDAYAAAMAAGAGSVIAPCLSPEPGVRMAWVTDPEGNLVELLDRTHLTR